MAQGSIQSGIALMLASIGLISVVDTVCKVYTAELPAMQIVWGYFMGILLSLSGYFAWRRIPLRRLLSTRRPILQWARPGLLVSSIVCLYIGLTYLPLAEATAIGFMAPLFVTALSAPLLKERVGWHRWLAVLTGLAGVLIIVQPGGALWHWAAAMPLAGALAFAGYQLATRMLAASDSTETTLGYTALGGALWISLAVPFVWQPLRPEHWFAFFATGAMGAAAHLCLIRAFGLAQASLLAPFNYSKLVWVAILGFLVFGDVPAPATLIGGALIIACGLYVLMRERARPPLPSARVSP